MSFELKQPSNRLVTLIESFADSAVNTIELFEAIRDQAYLEGFSGYDLKLLLRHHLRKKMAARTLRWYLKMLEDSTSENRQFAGIDYKILPEDINLLNEDFRDAEIADNSIDLIFTDPPYDAKSLNLYVDLAKMADNILKPGGSLITYVGQYMLPDILDLILHKSTLRYWWMICIKHTGGQSQMYQKKITVQWKPLLWFVKGSNLRDDLTEFIRDFVESEQPDKLLHEWAQSPKEASHMISKLTKGNETVLDPFMGSGTTGIAAISLKRKFTGIEKDFDKFQVAKSRLCKHLSQITDA
jgi:16S rRNA G966 N2-methylase RsmD